MGRYFVNTSEGTLVINDLGEREVTIRGMEVVDADLMGDVDSSMEWNIFVKKGFLKEITQEQGRALLAARDEESEVVAEDNTIIIDLTNELAGETGAEDTEDYSSDTSDEEPQEASVDEEAQKDVGSMTKRELLNKILNEVDTTITSNEGDTMATIAEAPGGADVVNTEAKKVAMKKGVDVETKFIDLDNRQV